MDADAIAGLAFVAVHRKAPRTVSELLAQAQSVNDCAALVLQLEEFAPDRAPYKTTSDSGQICPHAIDEFNLVYYPLSVLNAG